MLTVARLALSYQKPQILEYNNTHDFYGSWLASEAEVPSDKLLLPLLQSNRILERIHDSLPLRNSKRRSFVPFQEEVHIQTFENEVDYWRQSLEDDIKSLR